jgi:hypothetical protein
LMIIFLHGEIFEFPQLFFCKAKVWHTPYSILDDSCWVLALDNGNLNTLKEIKKIGQVFLFLKMLL